ncbi:UNVERIFIED_CONTAM: hypothetical protein FKN15_045111 [Acipenser sinensis]
MLEECRTVVQGDNFLTFLMKEQSRVRKDDMNDTAYSDAPLTQMMDYIQQREIERLFDIAMECLDLAAPDPEPSTSRAAPRIPGLGLTGWRAERREHRFGDLADYTHEGKEVAAALVHISDHEFYIPAVITLQAKQLLEESRVRKDDMNDTAYSDAPLTQMMDYIQQREIERLFDIAMECLDLAAPDPEPSTSRAAPRIPGLGLTGWRAERREHRDRSPFSLPTAHLIIPPEQREILENIPGTKSLASPPEAQNKKEGVQAAALHSSPPASLKLPTDLPWSDSLPSQLGTQQAESDNPNSTLQLFTDSSSCTREPAEKMAAVASGQQVLEHESIKASITSYQKPRHANVSSVPSSSMLPSGRAQASGGSLPGTTVIPRDRSVTPSLVDRWSPSVAASSSDEELVLRSKPAKRKCQVVDSDSEEIFFNTDDEDVVRAPETVNPRRKQVQLKPCLTFLNAEKAAKNTVTAGKAAKNTVTAGKAAKNTVTAGKAAKNTVTAGKAAKNTVTAGKAAKNTVTAGKAAKNTVTAGKAAKNTVTAGKAAKNTVTAGKAAKNTVTAGKAAKNTVTAGKAAKNTVTAGKAAKNTVTAGKAAKNTVTAGKAAKNTVTAGKAAKNTVTAGKAAKNTVTAGKAAKNTVTAGKAAKNTVTAGKAAKNTVTAGKATLGAVAKSCKEQTVTNQQVSKASNKNGSTSGAGDLQKPAVVSRTLKSANKSHSTAGMINLEAVAKSCKEQTVTNQQVSKASNKNGSTTGTRDHQKTAMKHRDGTSFMYAYEPPSAELVKRINSLRVPDSLLIWAWQYISKPD